MKSALAIAAGILVGFALAGLVAPALTLALPPRLHGPVVPWLAAAVLVPTFALLGGLAASRTRHRR